MVKKLKKGKEVRDVNEMETENNSNEFQIIQGNIPILSVQLLNAINKNLMVLIKQNKSILERLDS